MPSPAAFSFSASLQKARILSSFAGDARLRPLSTDTAQICLHAALATYVASWDSYIKKLVIEFYSETSDPLSPSFFSFHTLLKSLMETASERLNTPNAENARNFLILYTGYDPIGDWIWPRRNMGGLDVRLRLNEIFRIRHSFAHGFQMPAFNWNTSRSGQARLTAAIIRDIDSFFINLVKRTDRGMKTHIMTSYNLENNW
jgi:hypothetical protein